MSYVFKKTFFDYFDNFIFILQSPWRKFKVLNYQIDRTKNYLQS